MSKLTHGKWASLALLSIIVPVGLLTTFRLTGVLKEPPTPETIAVEAVKWESERPDAFIHIDQDVRSFYEKEIKLVEEIFIYKYVTDDEDGSDYVLLKINVTAALQSGFVNSANIFFREDDENSEVRFFEVQAWPKFYSHAENLSIVNYVHHLKSRGLKAFMTLAGINHPKSVHFDGIVHWILQSPPNKTHLIEITMDLVYYNGTAYKKVIQPFLLKMGPDDNNTFETAMAISEGKYNGLYIGNIDTVDYYKIYANHGQRITVDIEGASSPDQPLLNVCIYDPEKKLAIRTSKSDYSQIIEFTSNSTGYWYIELRRISGFEFYSMEARG